MQFLDLVDRRLFGLTRSPLELLRRSCTALALSFDGVVIVVDFLFFVRFGGVVIELEVLEVELWIVSMS
jgi:hypothetical protein